jgi:hypothetical protein
MCFKEFTGYSFIYLSTDFAHSENKYNFAGKLSRGQFLTGQKYLKNK